MNKTIVISLLSSLVLHAVLVFTSAPNLKIKTTHLKPHQFKIRKIRTVGSPKSTKDSVSIKQASHEKRVKKSLSLNDLMFKPESQKQLQRESIRLSKKASKKKKFQAIRLNQNNISSFLSDDQNRMYRPSAVPMTNSEILVQLEVPKGVKEDKLNKFEMVFYAFQKRIAKTYVNSFYKELQNFQYQNPHLKFPMTSKKLTITGRVTYDFNGDIIRIENVRWSHISRLQDFFMDLLKNLNTFPNPPEDIIHNGEFSLYFSLTVNG